MSTKTILLLDDNKAEIQSIRSALRKLAFDHTLLVADNGQEGLDILTGNTTDGTRIIPDIILLDVNLPVISGFDFLKIIRSYYSLKNIKTYLLSYSYEEHDRLVALNLGAQGFIKKPLNFNSSTGDVLSLINELKREVHNK
jgi:CheY-like chemotaxis protein